jgi:5-methylcytosine-specific restriction protein A
MPTAPLKPCAKRGCGHRVREGYCGEHERPQLAEQRRDLDARRPSAHARGYDRRWQRASRLFLQRNPLCVDCAAEGRDAAATVVDHHVPHKGHRDLFWDQSNWRARCKTHHDRKTARQDGGFGRTATVP